MKGGKPVGCLRAEPTLPGFQVGVLSTPPRCLLIRPDRLKRKSIDPTCFIGMRTLENRNNWSSLLREIKKDNSNWELLKEFIQLWPSNPPLQIRELTKALTTAETQVLVKKLSSNIVDSRFVLIHPIHWSIDRLIDWLTACLSDWRTDWLLNWLIDQSIHWIPTRKPYKCTTPGYTPYPANHKKDNGWQLHDSHKTIDAQNGGSVHECRISSSEEESYQTGYNCPCKDTNSKMRSKP